MFDQLVKAYMFAYAFCFPVTYFIFLIYQTPTSIETDILKIFSANFGTLYGIFLDAALVIYVFAPIIQGCRHYRKTSTFKNELKKDEDIKY